MTPLRRQPQRWGMMILGEVLGRTNTHGWLKSYDPDGHDGAGDIQVTDDDSEAKQFESLEDILTCWKQVSTVQPIRWDGRPNRPLSAYTIEGKLLP